MTKFEPAEEFNLPYLGAYLDSIGTNFRHGANFATGGSSILPGGYSPFHLNLQISQFIQFKSRTTTLYKQLSRDSESAHWIFVQLRRYFVPLEYHVTLLQSNGNSPYKIHHPCRGKKICEDGLDPDYKHACYSKSTEYFLT